MSKLDRDLKAIMEEAFSSGELLLKAFIPKMFEDVIDEDELMQELAKLIAEGKPKTYDDYIRDMKRAFLNDGWVAPTNDTEFMGGGESL